MIVGGNASEKLVAVLPTRIEGVGLGMESDLDVLYLHQSSHVTLTMLVYLLYGIEQRFYTTPFGKEKRLANSVQPI